MKKIQEILKGKISRDNRGGKAELDEKTIVKVFLEAVKGELKNFDETDIRDTKFKNKILYIKTIHPVVSSELFLRRENIIKRINKIAGKAVVERMVI